MIITKLKIHLDTSILWNTWFANIKYYILPVVGVVSSCGRCNKGPRTRAEATGVCSPQRAEWFSGEACGAGAAGGVACGPREARGAGPAGGVACGSSRGLWGGACWGSGLRGPCEACGEGPAGGVARGSSQGRAEGRGLLPMEQSRRIAHLHGVTVLVARTDFLLIRIYLRLLCAPSSVLHSAHPNAVPAVQGSHLHAPLS